MVRQGLMQPFSLLRMGLRPRTVSCLPSHVLSMLDGYFFSRIRHLNRNFLRQRIRHLSEEALAMFVGTSLGDENVPWLRPRQLRAFGAKLPDRQDRCFNLPLSLLAPEQWAHLSADCIIGFFISQVGSDMPLGARWNYIRRDLLSAASPLLPLSDIVSAFHASDALIISTEMLHLRTRHLIQLNHF